MTIEASLVQDGCSIDWTADADYSGGDVIQLWDGRAGVVSTDVVSGLNVGVYVGGIFKVQKTATMVMLLGSKLFWDHSANKAHLLHGNDRDFYLGCAQSDALSAGTTVNVALNVQPVYTLNLANGFASVPIQTAGFPAVIGTGEGVNLILQAASEAQKVDAMSLRGAAIAGIAFVDILFCYNVNGTTSAVDINLGLANGTHATDADSVTESMFVHLDGGDLKINLKSTDGTTTVASTDTTVAFVVGTPVLVQFDLRNLLDIQAYVNGVNVLPSSVFKLNLAVGPMKLLAHAEKTSGTAVGNISVALLGARTAQ